MLFSLILSAGLLSAVLHDGISQMPADTLHDVPIVTLRGVTVMADKGVVVSRGDTLSSVNSLSVSDVLQTVPGLHVGDNGGFAGLKSVSLRGMGSAHTSIYLDGVRVGNVQAGQCDLTFLGIENLGSAVVDYAQNCVSFKTARPVFADGPLSGDFRLSAGSFGTLLPSARLDVRLSERYSLTASASGVFSKGNYSYNDSLIRENNDIRQVRASLDLFGKIAGGEVHLKTFYHGADRGTPGSVEWPSDDRQRDRNIFLQGNLQKKLSPLYTLRMSSKLSHDGIAYTSEWGDSRYVQTEFQLNSAHDFQVRNWLKLSMAADVQWDGLTSDAYEASRFSTFFAFSSSFRTSRFSADAALECSGAFDKDALSRTAFSPSLGLRYKVLEGFDLVAFGRRAYRVPVFNELYYVGYGNPELQPEDAWLTDIGIDFSRSIGGEWRINAKVDGFCNLLKDKITSAPSEEDPDIWKPYNIGKVRSVGVDAAAGFMHGGEWTYSLNMKWSFQSALDMTEGSFTYGQQIPYIARHTLILDGLLEWKKWALYPLWTFRAGRTDGYGGLPPWNTLDLSVFRSFEVFDSYRMAVKLTSKNLLDCRYEVVTGYPMPGRSVLCGIELKF